MTIAKNVAAKSTLSNVFHLSLQHGNHMQPTSCELFGKTKSSNVTVPFAPKISAHCRNACTKLQCADARRPSLQNMQSRSLGMKKEKTQQGESNCSHCERDIQWDICKLLLKKSAERCGHVYRQQRQAHRHALHGKQQ